MKINEIFKDNYKEIKEAIENLPVLNCVNNYYKYIDSTGESEFEKKFISTLSYYESTLYRKFIEKIYEDKSKDELISEIYELKYEGSCAACDNCFEIISEDFSYLLDKEKAHKIIQSFMLEVLEKSYKEFNTNNNNKIASELEHEIVDLKSQIESIEKKKEKLKNLEKELENLKGNEV
ncbi:hypothetical protein U729_3214 (plasmid) [Clostridium baratii str. Sullivan]|uniref:Uncharacterized protein n=1 Tax=Clostridium baratii str. Sullivan TaxID=1415775 RepID=A0A0A7G070_9CLOT|nr:hypothetical protein [Clostridium baratii]AIY85248.1 hypothetical protein U729_3214 [Clostridium baratii str. Sullivan]